MRSFYDLYKWSLALLILASCGNVQSKSQLGDIFGSRPDDIFVGASKSPSIQVSLFGFEMRSGQNAVVDFGSLLPNAEETELSFRVSNLGPETLIIRDISLPKGFIITEELDREIAVGDFDDFTVKLRTSSRGEFFGQLRIYSNANESVFSFPIYGEITLTPSLGNFIFVPETYVRDSNLDIPFKLNPDLEKAGGYVVFQTWSETSSSVEAGQVAGSVPFLYYNTSLNDVSLGGAEVQALVRNSSHQNQGTVRARNYTNFVSAPTNPNQPQTQYPNPPQTQDVPQIQYMPAVVSHPVDVALVMTPENTGGSISNCVISPALPSGLSINSTSCVISGVPTMAQAMTNYTVTASNDSGSSQASISLTITDPDVQPPFGYSGPISLSNGSTTLSNLHVVSNNPSVNQGQGISAQNNISVDTLTLTNIKIDSFNYGIYCGNCNKAIFQNLDITARDGGDSYSIRGSFNHLISSDSIYRADRKSHRFYNVHQGSSTRDVFLNGRLMLGGGTASEWENPTEFKNFIFKDGIIDVNSVQIYSRTHHVVFQNMDFADTNEIYIDWGAHDITFINCHNIPYVKYGSPSGGFYNPTPAQLAERNISFIP